MPKWTFLECIGFALATVVITCLSLHRGRMVSPALVIGGKGRPTSDHLSKMKVAGLLFVNSIQLGAALYLLRTAFARGHTWLEARPIDGLWAGLRFALELVLLFVIADTWFYWTHRLMHRSRWLYKNIHIIHHASRFPNAWLLTYHHPVDFFAVVTLPWSLIAFLPIPFSSYAYLAAFYLSVLTDIGGHSGYEVTRDWRGKVFALSGWATLADPRRRWISKAFTTTLHHDLHHQAFNKNFAIYFNFWDQVCGTLHAHTERPEKYLEAMR